MFQKEKNEQVNAVKVNLYILYQGFFAINLKYFLKLSMSYKLVIVKIVTVISSKF